MRFRSIVPMAFTIPRKQTTKRMSEESMLNFRERKSSTTQNCKTLLMKNYTMTNHPRTYRGESKNMKSIFPLFPRTAFTGTLKVCMVAKLNTTVAQEKSDAEADVAKHRKH